MRSLGQGLWSLLAYTIGIRNANDSKYQHHDWLTRDMARIIWVQNPELASRPSSGASPCWPSSQLAPQRESPEISSRELQTGRRQAPGSQLEPPQRVPSPCSCSFSTCEGESRQDSQVEAALYLYRKSTFNTSMQLCGSPGSLSSGSYWS